ncbi:MAG TPA: hypothetical protein VG099_13515 [Gemmataceae bacterium]|jgi:hypothetical protein|nr:hypothetical protein [Gemmataceae bacterium]
MVVKRKPTAGNGSALASKRAASCQDVIRRVLCKAREIEAVFLLTDDANIVHVFSVVREFQAAFYDKLLKKEQTIAKVLPEIVFEFHLRAHQGREPALAVPFDAELVYCR